MAQVTIVVRTRDRILLLRRALASIAAQTFQDFELVIVNDGGHSELVRELLGVQDASLQERTRLVHNETSHGREAALGDGLAASTCQYFAVHDDDDSWNPDFLRICVDYLDSHPEAGAVATRCDVVHEHIEGHDIIEDSREVLASDMTTWSLVDTMVVNFIPPISQLVRRSAADDVGHWDGSLQTQADWDFNLRLQSCYAVGFIDTPVLAHWHQRPAQGNALGNSVVDHARQHQRDNLAIRDHYIRQSASKDLGAMLVSAEYFQRLDTTGRHYGDEILQSLNAAHSGLAHLISLTEAQGHRIEELQEEVDHLRQLEESRYATVRSLIQRVPLLHKAARHIKQSLQNPRS